MLDAEVGADANTFVDVAYVSAYATLRGREGEWEGEEPQQVAAIVRAADYLANSERFQFKGRKQYPDQVLPFPREGCTEAGGGTVPVDAVPRRVKYAQCELAIRAMSGEELQPDLERGGLIAEESVEGATSTTYMDNAPGETVIPAVRGLLAPYLEVIDVSAATTSPVAPVAVQLADSPYDTLENDELYPFSPGAFRY